MRSVEAMLQELRVAKGLEAADLLLKNAKIVLLHSEEIWEGCLYVHNGRIVALHKQPILEAKETFDAEGRYLVPGLIDAHIHIEPTLLTPETLADVIVPHGTTTLLTDAMEIGNVAGLPGVEALMNASQGLLKYNLWLEVPSRVPTAPGLETTGGVLGVEEVRCLLNESYSVSMGELDPSKVLGLREEYFEKIAAAHRLGKIANGHAAGLKWNDLNVYACAGLTDDHECVTYEEMLQRLRLGMTVMIREGSTERNLDELIGGLVKNKLNSDSIMFCTDDKHANDIRKEGHINYMVDRAIQLGVEPIKAIKMATLQTARHFRIDHLVGSLSPGRWADVLVVDDLRRIAPKTVFVHGKPVAKDGKVLERSVQGAYPSMLRETIHLSDDFSAAKFRVEADGDEVNVRIIHIYPDQIVNFGSIGKLPVKNGFVQTDTRADILKLAVVERYGKTGDVGVGFVKGFDLKEGALACSVAHDHHNIVVVGTNDEDMALAVRSIEKHQGALAAVSNGKIQAVLPLPIAGLMSDLCADEVIERIEHLNEAARAMGCKLPSPFMTLSFISLPTVPELGITDKGLVDVKSHAIIPVFP
jgi:adenine deaminase